MVVDNNKDKRCKAIVDKLMVDVKETRRQKHKAKKEERKQKRVAELKEETTVLSGEDLEVFNKLLSDGNVRAASQYILGFKAQPLPTKEPYDSKRWKRYIRPKFLHLLGRRCEVCGTTETNCWYLVTRSWACLGSEDPRHYRVLCEHCNGDYRREIGQMPTKPSGGLRNDND